jgi:hypothetical protein
MSARRSVLQRTAVLAVSVTTATGLAWAGASGASAHPGVYDSETCAQSLTRVWYWPGSIENEDGRQVLFSDAYETHVFQQPPCDAPPDTTPRFDPDRIGHEFPL